MDNYYLQTIYIVKDYDEWEEMYQSFNDDNYHKNENVTYHSYMSYQNDTDISNDIKVQVIQKFNKKQDLNEYGTEINKCKYFNKELKKNIHSKTMKSVKWEVIIDKVIDKRYRFFNNNEDVNFQFTFNVSNINQYLQYLRQLDKNGEFFDCRSYLLLKNIDKNNELCLNVRLLPDRVDEWILHYLHTQHKLSNHGVDLNSMKILSWDIEWEKMENKSEGLPEELYNKLKKM